MIERCLLCEAESTYGCHGIKDGEVYSEHFCDTHYFANKRGEVQEAEKVEDEAS